MTSDEIERYNPTPLELTRTQTDDWFDVFPSIIKLAEYVADTEFVPDAMRRRPAAVAAAVLTGRELGLPPMVALRHLFVVKGKVGQSAELMRALVLRAGHEIRYIESTDQRCICEGRRKDEKDWTRVQFTAQDAKSASIDLRGYAADKLVARATSRLARRKFADVIMGLPTVDELEDYSDTASVVELAPDSPAVQRKRQPRKPKAAATQPKPAPPASAAADDDDLLDDDTVDIPPADLNQAQANLQAAELLAEEISTENDDVADLFTPPEPEPPMSKQQRGLMFTLLDQIGVTTHENRCTIATYILGYTIETTGTFTSSEANKVISKIQQWQTEHSADVVADRVNEILNEAAIAQAEEEADGD